jgi:hypothetical protein
MSFAEAHRRVGAGDRLPGESTDHASRQDADHWIRVYGELVRFKRGLLAVAENRHALSIDASMEGAADEALIFGQMRRYEPRLEGLDVYVSRLRRKLESPSSPNLIETVRGTGYRLAPPKDPRSAAAAPA